MACHAALLRPQEPWQSQASQMSLCSLGSLLNFTPQTDSPMASMGSMPVPSPLSQLTPMLVAQEPKSAPQVTAAVAPRKKAKRHPLQLPPDECNICKAEHGPNEERAVPCRAVRTRCGNYVHPSCSFKEAEDGNVCQLSSEDAVSLFDMVWNHSF